MARKTKATSTNSSTSIGTSTSIGSTDSADGLDGGIAPAPGVVDAPPRSGAAPTSTKRAAAVQGAGRSGTGADGEAQQPVEAADAPAGQPSRSKPPTKLAQVTQALQSPAGATLAQLGTLTGWQPHSIRAALSGLRKAGHAITTNKDAGGATVYRIAPSTGEEASEAARTSPPAEEPQADAAHRDEDTEPHPAEATHLDGHDQPAGANS